jgi:hypothetical protein
MNNGRVMKVMSDAEWAGLSAESRHNLNTLFGYSQFPAPGDESIQSISFNERELKALHEAMAEKDMSAAAVIRHFFRMGQLVDHYTKQDYKLLFRKDGKDFDPFDTGPKAAPMPVKGGHIDCPCWATGQYSRVEGCPQHPYDL